MNEPLIPEKLMQLPLHQTLSYLERTLEKQEHAMDIHFLLSTRDALGRRQVAENERLFLARILIVIARACRTAASSRDGMVSIELAEQALFGLDDKWTTYELQSIRGNLCMDLGDFLDALSSHSCALTIARTLPDRDAEISSIGNLAALLVDFGGHWEGIKLCEQVLELNRTHPIPAHVTVSALATMAEACLATHQAERGIEACNTALTASANADGLQGAQLFIIHVLLARLHLLRGRVSASERELELARNLAPLAGTSRAGRKIDIAAALIDHENGKLRQAVQSLKESLVLAGANNALSKEALSALVTVYEKEGHPKAAFKYLQRLAKMNERADLGEANKRLEEFGLLKRAISGPILVKSDSQSSNDFRLQAAALQKKMIDSQLEVLERLAVAAEMRDDVTGLHCYRVGRWAHLIALELGLPDIDADTIEIAARLHDVGKISVPDHILMKPGKLTAAEFEVMKRHTLLGARLLSRSKTPQVRLAEKVALTHHERWDGSGYPQGLAGNAIPVAGRITAVADVFDALMHERPYKRAWPLDEALLMIQSMSGSGFDPTVTSAFFSVANRLLATNRDLDKIIESQMKRARIMRIRDYALCKEEFNPDDSGAFHISVLRRTA